MEEPAAPVAPASKLVMIIDDDVSMRDFMGYIVKKEGFRSELSADGREALRKIDAAAPDLILLDFMIPGMGGYEVLRELQATGHGDIPIIVVTGREMDGASVNLLLQEGNVKDFLQKPVGPTKLAAAMHRVLGTAPTNPPRKASSGW